MTITAKPIVLLSNVSFVNKGDALMAAAIEDRLRPDYIVAYPLHASIHSHRHLVEYLTHLYSDIPNWSVKRTVFNAAVRGVDLLTSLAPSAVRTALGIANDRDISAVLDVSGYCFGDHWGEDRITRSTAAYRRWSKRGMPVVLMPKTWGPFDTISNTTLNAMFEWVTLAYARDLRSFETMRRILTPANMTKLRHAPDYTNGVSGVPSQIDVSDAFLIIPSYRMIDSGTISRDAYAALMSQARQLMAADGTRACLLLHEASNDRWFAENAGQMGFAAADVVQVEDERELKWCIGQSRGVLTSRLHGLYNSLNGGIPVLVAAWSYKYDEALKQYDCEECLLDAADLSTSLTSKINLLLDPAQRSSLSSKMLTARERHQSATELMWSEVLTVLKQ